MADIEKHMVARLPLNTENTFTFNYKTLWNNPTKKIWDKKEVERHIYSLANEEGVFECNPEVGNKIADAVEKEFNDFDIDKNNIEDVEITIYDLDNKKIIGVNTDDLPRLKSGGNNKDKEKLDRINRIINNIDFNKFNLWGTEGILLEIKNIIKE